MIFPLFKIQTPYAVASRPAICGRLGAIAESEGYVFRKKKNPQAEHRRISMFKN